jgi:hypothetical protein
MIQIDGPMRRVYIKFHISYRALSVLRETAGRQEFRHDNGELSIDHTDLAGMGVRSIRLANLPPEIPDKMIRDALSQYREVTEVQEDYWSKAYRYLAYNGILIAVTKLKKHLPSHTLIARTSVLTTYEGQPPTCYGCNEQGHQYQDCPRRKHSDTRRDDINNPSWADVVTQGTRRQQLELMSPTDVTSHITNEIGMTDALNTSKPRREKLRTTARAADEDADMDTQTPDGEDHEQQTPCGGQPDRVKTNDRTSEQEAPVALNTMALTDAPSQDTFHVDMGDPVDQSVRDHGKGRQ